MHLIELDENNPDVARAWENHPLVTTIKALSRTAEDWEAVGGLIESLRVPFIVVNMPANQRDKLMGTETQLSIGEALSDICSNKESGFNFLTFWPMARQDDGYDDFVQYAQIVEQSYLYPMPNLYFANSSINDFDFVTSDKYEDIRNEVKARGDILTLYKSDPVVAAKMRTEGHPDNLKLLHIQRRYWQFWQKKMDESLNIALAELVRSSSAKNKTSEKALAQGQ